MNREIKFRAWDNNQKKMAYIGDGSPFTLTYGAIIDMFEDEDLMQYTGLKDKNGKEIYEGDILKNNREAIRIVFWDNEMASWYTKSNTDEFLPVSLRIAMTQSTPDVNFLEIIGNIYENPELLK